MTGIWAREESHTAGIWPSQTGCSLRPPTGKSVTCQFSGDSLYAFLRPTEAAQNWSPVSRTLDNREGATGNQCARGSKLARLLRLRFAKVACGIWGLECDEAQGMYRRGGLRQAPQAHRVSLSAVRTVSYLLSIFVDRTAPKCCKVCHRPGRRLYSDHCPVVLPYPTVDQGCWLSGRERCRHVFAGLRSHFCRHGKQCACC